MKDQKKSSFLEQWTIELNHTKLDMIAWAMGQQRDDATWWARNWIHFLFFGLLLLLVFICWLFGWSLMLRVIMFLFILQLIRAIYGWVVQK